MSTRAKPNDWSSAAAARARAGCGLSEMSRLGRDRDLVMEKLRCKIRPVGPRKSVGLSIDLEVGKVLEILKWFEYRAVEFIREVDLTVGSVVELNPYDEISDMTCICYSNHVVYSNGAII